MGEDIHGSHAHDRSGQAISLSGDGKTVAIGSVFNSDGGTHAGVAQIYTYIKSSWVQLGQSLPGEFPGDESGTSVSLSSNGRIVAIGSKRNDSYGNENSGSVRVFALTSVPKGFAWLQMGRVSELLLLFATFECGDHDT